MVDDARRVQPRARLVDEVCAFSGGHEAVHLIRVSVSVSVSVSVRVRVRVRGRVRVIMPT